MRYVGLDVHKHVVQVAVLSQSGELVLSTRVDCTRDALLEFARRKLLAEDRVVLEATTNTWAVVDLLEPHVAEVVVSNPMRTKAIAQAKIKTDKVDARVLADLLRCDYLPRVWQPDAETRRKRRLGSRRASLVADRTGIKNRIHSVLHQRLLRPDVAELFGTAGRAWLEKVELDADGRAAVDSELRLLDHLEAEIRTLEQEIAENAHDDPQVRLLMTLPGFNVSVAHGLSAALGNIDRFSSGDRAASYVGIVPSTRQSANHCYHGPITKQGRSHARWLVIQAAQHLDKHPGPLGVFFRRLAKKKNRNVAVVATARKLVVIAWHMLKNNEPYRYAIPHTTDLKLAKLRVRATGKRRTGGNPKGAPRPAAYGTGRRTRAIPSVDEAYARQDLPPRQALRDGERRMLEDNGIAPFVEQIATSRRVPCRARKGKT